MKLSLHSVTVNGMKASHCSHSRGEYFRRRYVELSACAANIRPDIPGVPMSPARVPCSVSATTAQALSHHIGEGAPERQTKEDVQEEIDDVVREHEQLEDGEAHVRVGRHVRLLVGGHLQHVEHVDAMVIY